MSPKATATARAHSNIALAKYWGKRDLRLNLPAVGSISITLEGLYTETQVCFRDGLTADRLSLQDRPLNDDRPRSGRSVDDRHVTDRQQTQLERVSAFLDLIRERAGIETHAEVTSRNNFPTGAGLASSASGFAALTLAAAGAAGLKLSAIELSVLARRGSGSAARSIFGGFVEMHRGETADGSDAYAEPLVAPTQWPLAVVVAVTNSNAKPIGSTAAMLRTAETSAYYRAWVDSSGEDLDAVRTAITDRDFAALGEAAEHSCLRMHGLMFSARPGICYWNATTMAVIHTVKSLRHDGLPVYFTIDAGPQVKVVCEPENAGAVARALEAVPGVQKVLNSGLGPGAHLIETDPCK